MEHPKSVWVGLMPTHTDKEEAHASTAILLPNKKTHYPHNEAYNNRGGADVGKV